MSIQLNHPTQLLHFGSKPARWLPAAALLMTGLLPSAIAQSHKSHSDRFQRIEHAPPVLNKGKALTNNYHEFIPQFITLSEKFATDGVWIEWYGEGRKSRFTYYKDTPGNNSGILLIHKYIGENDRPTSLGLSLPNGAIQFATRGVPRDHRNRKVWILEELRKICEEYSKPNPTLTSPAEKDRRIKAETQNTPLPFMLPPAKK